MSTKYPINNISAYFGGQRPLSHPTRLGFSESCLVGRETIQIGVNVLKIEPESPDALFKAYELSLEIEKTIFPLGNSNGDKDNNTDEKGN